ncbi:glycosyltransferase involved in cell wall biosynthesis [Luteibacter rhizovicinus]|uniref:Glycosyltransferase involved in cell wall biosynthesis n=1 Tax=Luteibacter rhizovicinus TaxID=242606 RepID=A0A4R3YWT2_9GAMM|nr:glycosyltransferase family 4 protein [Luteibacter rhizovicinus]TCV97615.1 glycosyltransferase involved in cell wall biosynthesis [Luteibacter rhizovicinus]
MKILVLTNLFPTPWDPLRGAFNRQQFALLGQRHEVDVLTAVDFRERMAGRRGDVDVPGLRTGHFVFVYPPRIGRSLHALCWFASLMWQHGRRLRAGHYDALLVSWAYPDGAAAGWVARRLGIPYVVKVHGSDLNVQAEHALRRVQIRSALRGAGAVVAVSRALGEKAIALGCSPDRVHVVYNGIDNALFSPGSRSDARERVGLPASVPVVLYVGNLKASKGCIDLINAFPAVLAIHPDARLVFVGAGPCRDALLARAGALGCTANVELRGAFPHHALGDWFRAATVLCLPSHNEGVPNVVLEAMACGTPVVATRVGGIPEVVPDYAGTLVPVNDVAALGHALNEALGHRFDYPRIAAHASMFRWDDNVDALERILHDVAAAASLPIGVSA